MSLYGSYQKAVAIYNLPSAFMVALTASIVPAISACLAKKDGLGAGKIARRFARSLTHVEGARLVALSCRSARKAETA